MTPTTTTPSPRTAMPPYGDERPGRSAGLRTALVVNPDAALRCALAAELRADGYSVMTCPGPLAGTTCPAREGAAAAPCPRVRRDLDLVLLDERTARTRLPESYRSWEPRLPVSVTGRPRAVAGERPQPAAELAGGAGEVGS